MIRSGRRSRIGLVVVADVVVFADVVVVFVDVVFVDVVFAVVDVVFAVIAVVFITLPKHPHLTTLTHTSQPHHPQPTLTHLTTPTHPSHHHPDTTDCVGAQRRMGQ